MYIQSINKIDTTQPEIPKGRFAGCLCHLPKGEPKLVDGSIINDPKPPQQIKNITHTLINIYIYIIILYTVCIYICTICITQKVIYHITLAPLSPKKSFLTLNWLERHPAKPTGSREAQGRRSWGRTANWYHSRTK